MKTTTFDVLFLSPITGTWKLQHSFQADGNALRCGENLARFGVSALVFRVTREAGKVVAEKQLAEFKRAA